jgi:hypothetical protein
MNASHCPKCDGALNSQYQHVCPPVSIELVGALSRQGRLLQEAVELQKKCIDGLAEKLCLGDLVKKSKP